MRSKKVKTFKSMLDGLTADRDRIGHLTSQARADLNYQSTLADVDVNAIVQYTISQPAQLRLPGLYLIDSICQNVGGRYVHLFEEHIFRLIETTYRYGNQNTRKSLCKLLNIWKNRKIFSFSILKQIYHALNKLDNEGTHQPSDNNNNININTNNSYYNLQTQTPHPTHTAHPTPHNHQSYYNQPPNPSHHWQQPPLYHNQFGPNNSNHFQHPQHAPHHTQGMHHDNKQQMYIERIGSLLSELNAFIANPYRFRNGTYLSPKARNSNDWKCSNDVAQQMFELNRQFDANSNAQNNDLIIRTLYLIIDKLRLQGCANTNDWFSKLQSVCPMKLSEFVKQSMPSNNENNNTQNNNNNQKNKSDTVCTFYNTEDGCHFGSTCTDLHITQREFEISKKLKVRCGGRYTLSDLKFENLSLDIMTDKTSGIVGHGHTAKVATFYSYYGRDAHALSKKHARSVSLLLSKKLKPCPNCGLRFSSLSFSRHMSWHRSSQKKLEMKKTQTFVGKTRNESHLCRSWYVPENEWFVSNDSNKIDLNRKEVNPFDELGNEVALDSLLEAMDKNKGMPSMHGGLSHHSLGGLNGNNAMSKMDENAVAINANVVVRDDYKYANSRVLLNNSKQTLICGICGDPFTSKFKKYASEYDDWVLSGACYLDGSTLDSYSNGRLPANLEKRLKIVHRQCFELKKKQSLDGNDESLRPKLHDPNNVISQIEDHWNESNNMNANETDDIINNNGRNVNKKRKLEEVVDDGDMDGNDGGSIANNNNHKRMKIMEEEDDLDLMDNPMVYLETLKEISVQKDDVVVVDDGGGDDEDDDDVVVGGGNSGVVVDDDGGKDIEDVEDVDGSDSSDDEDLIDDEDIPLSAIELTDEDEDDDSQSQSNEEDGDEESNKFALISKESLLNNFF